MDTTEKYIKRCKKAEKIQKGWELAEGDWVAMNGGDYTVGCFNSDDADIWTVEELIEDKQAIWLPRQDQLQEMIEWDHNFYIQIGSNALFDKFHSAMLVLNRKDEVIWTSQPYVNTWEQLWLAFVMHEKYDKVWDAGQEEWIIES